MRLTRREFLIAGGIAGGVMAARGLAFGQVIYAGGKNGKSEPIEGSVMTLCRQCPGGCGLRVRVADQCVVGIAGNPGHPINRGAICARAPAALQTLYNPDRWTGPAILYGPKGSGSHRPIDWPQALGRLAAKLRDARASPGPHSLAVMIGPDRGLTRLLWSRFLQAYGSNNLIDWRSPEAHQAYPAVWAMQGIKRPVGYDLAQARYVLSFGSQWLDDHWSPAQASEAFAAFRGRRQTVRPKFVHIEPRLSLTAAKADEWIPIQPGTDGALALGLAHVLVRERLYDREFVESLTYGFDDPAGGGRIRFRRLLLRDYSPPVVERITGVEVETIYRLAREFAAHKPALAIGFDGSGVASQRCYDRMAIHALNALVGSIDVPGGLTHFQEVPLLKMPVPEPDGPAQEGLAKPRIDATEPGKARVTDAQPELLAERILAERPYPIEILVLAGADPVFDSAHAERFRQALAKVPFVVSLSPWLDDSARWADLVIPDTHFLTRWDIDASHTLTGHPTVSLGQPVVASTSSSRGAAQLAIELAGKLGNPIAAAMPFPNTQAAVRAVCDTLFASGRGGAFGPTEGLGWTQLLERSGWRPPPATSADEFYRDVLASGGWCDPIYHHQEWARVFRSPALRFAFYSPLIEERIKPTAPQDHERCLPHYEPLPEAEPSAEFPLRLYIYPLSILAEAGDANVPWLIDASGAYMGQRWKSWAELNPLTARQYHIADGDAVVVTSPRGSLRLTAKLFEGIVPGAVAIPWGLGHAGGGRWAAGVGRSPSELVRIHEDPLTASSYWNATCVAVSRA